LEALTAADAAQGGLDIVTDLATLGVGLGMIFGGIFGKKKPKAPPPPPPPINPSFQAGVA
jgi:Na+/glutamate symporter